MQIHGKYTEQNLLRFIKLQVPTELTTPYRVKGVGKLRSLDVLTEEANIYNRIYCVISFNINQI